MESNNNSYNLRYDLLLMATPISFAIKLPPPLRNSFIRPRIPKIEEHLISGVIQFHPTLRHFRFIKSLNAKESRIMDGTQIIELNTTDQRYEAFNNPEWLNYIVMYKNRDKGAPLPTLPENSFLNPPQTEICLAGGSIKEQAAAAVATARNIEKDAFSLLILKCICQLIGLTGSPIRMLAEIYSVARIPPDQIELRLIPQLKT